MYAIRSYYAYIYGIGRTRSTKILAKAEVDANIRVKDLSEDDVRKIRQVIQDERNNFV